MRYHVIQHVSFETAGLLAEVIRERGHSLQVTALDAGELMPPTGAFDTLIVMGGPMSVHDEGEYPWLRAEKELIRAAIFEGKRVLGICLGAQLVAAVCGSRVYPNAQKEIGFWPVRWTSEERGNGRPGERREEVVFHWHGETFDLPEGAVLLASSDGCVNQAFRIGDRVLGIQFHPEVTPEIIGEMIGHEGWELVEGQYVQGAERILAAAGELGEGSPGMEWLWEWL